VFGGGGLRAALSDPALPHWFHAGDPTALDVDDGAVAELAAGRPRFAAAVLEDQLLREPHNLFALRLAQELHLRTCDRGNLSGSVSRVLPFWDRSQPGYYTVLGLHSRGLGEAGRWDLAEEAGMRALAESGRYENTHQDTTALAAVCDTLFLSGRSREGLRLLREISAERGPSMPNQQLDTAMACARAMYYIDIGSTELAEHQIDLVVGAVPTMQLDELARLSSVLWRSRCVAMLVAHNDVRNRHGRGGGGGAVDTDAEHSNVMHEAALEHSERKGLIWRLVWDRWVQLAARRGGQSLCVDGVEAGQDVDECGLNFGPGHAALATLVYGAQPENAHTGNSGNSGSDTASDDNRGKSRASDAPSSAGAAAVHPALSQVWSRAELGVSPCETTEKVFRALLAQSLHSSSTKPSVLAWNHRDAAALLLPVQYDLQSTLCSSAIFSDTMQVFIPSSCRLGGQAPRGRAILAERTFLRPGSPMLWSEYASALFAAGETMASQAADAKAGSLGFGQGGWNAH
jgi:hypothetical protein